LTGKRKPLYGIAIKLNNRINSDGQACGLSAGYMEQGGHVVKKQLTGEKLKQRAI
jgi:hypothetical protein